MFIIKGKKNNDFIKENDLELIFEPQKNKKFIKNDENVVCDEIKILKNLGIGYYLRGILVKFINAVNVTIEYEKDDCLFKIIYNDSLSEENTINKVFYIRYNKEDKISKKSYKERNNNVSLGEIVLPNNVILPMKNTKNKRSISGLLSDFIFKKIYCEESLKNFDLYETIDFFFDSFGYRVIEKTDLMLEKSYVFILKSEIKEDIIQEYSLEEEKLINETYCVSNNFDTKEDYYKLIEILKEKFEK